MTETRKTSPLGRVLLLSMTASVIAGCSVLPQAKNLAPRLALEAEAGSRTSDAQLPVTLVISQPSAEALYNTFNVAVATAPYQYEYLEGAEWTDRVPVVWRTFLERSFENTNALRAVGGREDIPLGADYELKTDIRAFHLDRTGRGEVARIGFGARIVDRRGQTVATRVFTSEEEPSGSGRQEQITAYNDAANSVTSELIDWTLTAIAADIARREAASGEMTGG